jgi:hypothetical protein
MDKVNKFMKIIHLIQDNLIKELNKVQVNIDGQMDLVIKEILNKV